MKLKIFQLIKNQTQNKNVKRQTQNPKMKTLLRTFFVFLMMSPLAAFCQNIEMRNFDFEPNPTIHKLSDVEKKEPVVCLSDKRVTEYIYSKDGELEAYASHYRL